MLDSRKAMLAVLLVCVVAVGALSRLVPHPPNFTPVASIALFAGFVLTDRRIALALVLATMVVSDMLIGFYNPLLMFSVYGSMTLMIVFSRFVPRRFHAGHVLTASLMSGFVYFVTTNIAVWAFGSMYDRTFIGLWTCLAAGVPFLKYTLASNLIFSGVLFGGYAAVTRLQSAKSAVPRGAE